MVCERLDNPLEQVLAATSSHFQCEDVAARTCWEREGVPARTCSNGLSNFSHTITITHTYGCNLQFVLLMMGVNSTRNILSKYSEIKNTYRSMRISLNFQSNMHITKMYGTMNIKLYVTVMFHNNNTNMKTGKTTNREKGMTQSFQLLTQIKLLL
jgi:hypothetical protein